MFSPKLMILQILPFLPLSTLPEFGKVMLESLVVVPIGFLSAATSTKNPRLKYL